MVCGKGHGVWTMAISAEEVEHVAKLARLALSEGEKELYRNQLSDVLEHIKKIGEVDISEIEPTSHVMPLVNVFREDEVRPSLTAEEALSNAPWATKGAFKVPKIV